MVKNSCRWADNTINGRLFLTLFPTAAALPIYPRRATHFLRTIGRPVLRGWAGYFHYGNSATVMNRMKHYSQNRLRRWLWRKDGCRRSLWEHYAPEKLHQRYGLFELPTTAAWRAAR
jgi:hypothetical protein